MESCSNHCNSVMNALLIKEGQKPTGKGLLLHRNLTQTQILRIRLNVSKQHPSVLFLHMMRYTQYQWISVLIIDMICWSKLLVNVLL